MKTEILTISKFNKKDKCEHFYYIPVDNIIYIETTEELLTILHLKNGDRLKFEFEDMKDTKIKIGFGINIKDLIKHYKEVYEDAKNE